MTADPPRVAARAATLRGELSGAAVVAVALAVLLTWPLVLHPASTVAGDLGDPLYQAWQLAWGGHGLLHQPLHLFDANIGYPLDNTLAFSDSLLGYAASGLVGDGVAAAVLRYNLVYLFALALAFFGAYVLARQLGVGRWPALVAGLAFAYAPWRYAHDGHLNILSSGGIPLALACLARGHAVGGGPVRPRWALAGWLVAAWQLTIGFGLGLQFGYLLGVLAVLGVAGWLARGRPSPDRRLVAADAAGVAAFAVIGALMALPYYAVVRDHPEARRTMAEVEFYSPPAAGLLAAPPTSRLWAGPTAGLRDDLSWPPEQTLFPGATLLVLAAAGLAAGSWSWRRRLALGAGTAVTVVLALGTRAGPLGAGYRALFDHAPGWQGIRTPGRLTTLVTLGLVLLAATGAERLLRAIPRTAVTVVGAVLVTAVLAEGLNTVPVVRPPAAPQAWHGVRGPVLALPSDDGHDYAAMLWSTEGLPRIVNGTTGFTPAELAAVRLRTQAFPDPESVALLRSLGVRTVLLDRSRAPGTPWAGADRRPTAGLGIRRTEQGVTVVYDLRPDRP